MTQSVPGTISDHEIWAVVPVKNLDRVKQRLASIFDETQRRALYSAMLQDVLSALSQTTQLAGIAVVTNDSQVHGLVAPYNARIIHEDVNAGHTAAVDLAARVLSSENVTGLLQVPGDVPLITPTDISTLVATHKVAPSITLTPSRDARGTNAVLCSPPSILPFQFGNDSFELHKKSAQSLGINPTIVPSPTIALDIDEPDDVHEFLRQPSNTHAFDYLKTQKIKHIDTIA